MTTEGVARSASAELAYSVEGDGPETVLLLMGLGMRAADWGSVFPASLVARGFRVVRFDHRGVGASPRAAPGYTLSELAADAVAVLDAASAPRAHVVGFSMGGMIAQLVALEHPARVAKLVLVSTDFGGPSLVPMHADAQKLFDPATFASARADAAQAMRITLSVIAAPGFAAAEPAAHDALVENARRQPTSASTFLGQIQAIMRSDRSARVAQITAPTLVVHGGSDRLVPTENGRSLAARIPGARLVILEGCGHVPMAEQPGALSAAINAFLGD